jgi:myo-inositol catabolism protein IolH
MKLALDPRMVRHLAFSEVFKVAADSGYRFLEWSPRDDFLPSYQGRRATREAVAEIRKASEATAVSIESIWVNYRWSSTDEAERKTAVRYWKQAFEVAIELGCRHLNTEFKGDPFRPEQSEAAFWRSMDELLPLIESEGLKLVIEPHPGDFVESGFRAVDIIRGIRSESVGYIYCVPHTFIMGPDMAELIRYAGPSVQYVHLADTYRPSRIIVDPHDAPVRVHQHLDIGQGEIAWDLLFKELKGIGYDGVMTVSVFAWPERAIESFRHNHRRATELMSRAGYEIT